MLKLTARACHTITTVSKFGFLRETTKAQKESLCAIEGRLTHIFPKLLPVLPFLSQGRINFKHGGL